ECFSVTGGLKAQAPYAERRGVLVTNHVLAGAAIGAVVERPLPALALGVVSHVAMDSVPHCGLAHGRRLPVLAGMVGAALLDLDKPGRYFVGLSPFPAAVDRFHARIQEGREHDHRMGQEFAVATGLAVLAVALVRLRRR